MRKDCAAVIMVVVLALGCASAGPVEVPQEPAPAPAKTIELGTSASELEALLGKPMAVQLHATDAGMEVWVYSVGKVVLYNGKVVTTDPSPFPRP